MLLYCVYFHVCLCVLVEGLSEGFVLDNDDFRVKKLDFLEWFELFRFPYYFRGDLQLLKVFL